MRWPWRRRADVETRSAQGFTALALQARAEAITGRRAAAELTAAVQACVSAWEGALSLADVSGTSVLSPRLLALLARSLALRGEFVALIGDDGLTPAADWDLSTAGGRARAYRVSLPDVGGGRSVTALAPEVVHVVIGAEAREPWRGTAPLRRSGLTAELLAALEAALAEVFGNAPLGSTVAPVPEMTAEDRDRLGGSFRGQRGRVLLRESAAVTAAGGPAPQTDWRPHSLSPELRDTMALEAWAEAKAAILAAYGVDPSLLSSQANGSGAREVQRTFATLTMQPIAALIGQELTEKLGTEVRLDVLRPLQAWDAGGRARAFATVVDAIAAAKAGGLSAEEVAGALRLVDWAAREA